MITFDCPYCHVKLDAEDMYAGKTVSCPGCGKACQIPDRQPAVTLHPVQREAPAKPVSRIPPWKIAGSVFLGCFGAIVVIVLIIVLVAGIFVTKSSDNTAAQIRQAAESLEEK